MVFWFQLGPRAVSDPHTAPRPTEQMARNSPGDHEDPPGWAGCQSFGCGIVLMKTSQCPLNSLSEGGDRDQPWRVFTQLNPLMEG